MLFRLSPRRVQLGPEGLEPQGDPEGLEPPDGRLFPDLVEAAERKQCSVEDPAGRDTRPGTGLEQRPLLLVSVRPPGSPGLQEDLCGVSHRAPGSPTPETMDTRAQHPPDPAQDTLEQLATGSLEPSRWPRR